MSAIAEKPRTARPATALMARLGSFLTAVVSLLALALVWEIAVRALAVPAYLLPAPSAIVDKVYTDLASGLIIPHFEVTLFEVISGFALAALSGLLLGSVIALVPIIDRIIYPYILVLQTIPKIAVAPLFLIWFGYGVQSKIITAALVGFFPVLVNVTAGLKTTDARRVLYMRALKASALQTFFKVRLPGMLPYFFAGLEVAIIFCIIGAIVGEFIGSSLGLGTLIIQRQGAVDVAGVFSVLFYLSVMGVVLNVLVKACAKRFAFWSHPDASSGL
jgi:NitT/TauT family transport system permease protein